MNLRVFSGFNDPCLIEISDPKKRSEFGWFVPMFPEGDPKLIDVHPDSLIALYFNGRRCIVLFRTIKSISYRNPDLKEIGQIEEDDSRNILNNIFDLLARD